MNKKMLVFVLLTLFALAGCLPQDNLPTLVPTQPGRDGGIVLPTQPPTTGEVVIGQAPVDSFDILLMESFPLQAAIVVRGSLPDGCTQLGEMTQVREGNVLRVTIQTQRPSEAICTMALVPFEQRYTLDILGLERGEYSVEVNGVKGSLRLDVDNIAQPMSYGLGGYVYHDTCANSAVGSGEPPKGCVNVNGVYAADGRMEAGEAGIAGVTVQLGSGACPAVGLATTVTAENGQYAFEVTAPGAYCVSIDPSAGGNAAILLPGAWTQPAADGIASLAVTLDDAMPNQMSTNFGWDHQFLPEPEAGEPACTNLAAWVADVTVSDGTEFKSADVFDKTWRVRNIGTCVWTSEYALVFDSGTQMGGKSPTSLTEIVQPDGTIDITVRMTAPNAPGKYRGDWVMSGPGEKPFRIGKNTDSTLWVEIVVLETEANLNLGDPSWIESFNNTNSFFPVNTANTLFAAGPGEMLMRANNPGQPEEWGLAYPELRNFYLEGTFITGETCSGIDRYGFIVRAPDASSGYIFNFSCDGRYRVYLWDGTNYIPLLDWAKSPSIVPGPEAKNVMGIWANGSIFEIYANGKLIAETSSDLYDFGRMGLLIGAGETAGFEVTVEEVRYWDLSR